MGILTRSDVLFLNASNGVLSNKKEGISTYAFEGILKKIEIKTGVIPTNNNKVTKVHLTFVEPDGSSKKTDLSFNIKGWCAVNFFRRAFKLDLSKPFVFGVSGSEKNEKVTFCWLKQGDIVEEDKPTKDGKGGRYPNPPDSEDEEATYLYWKKILPQFTEEVQDIQSKLDELNGKDVEKQKVEFVEEDNIPF